MDVNKFIKFHEVKRNLLTKAEAIEYLEVSAVQFNHLRKLNLIVPIEENRGGSKKLYFLHDDVVSLWNEMFEFDKNL